MRERKAMKRLRDFKTPQKGKIDKTFDAFLPKDCDTFNMISEDNPTD